MNRNGFATLLALALLATATAMVGGLLAMARITSLHSQTATARILTDDLLADGERLASTWLIQHAQQLVLPPTGGLLLLCDHRWTDHSGTHMRLAIAIHDVSATLPRSALVAGHPLRLALDAPGTGPVVRQDPSTIPAADLLETIDRPHGWALIPNLIPNGRPLGGVLSPQECASGPVLTCWFSPDTTNNINANTAPSSILLAACAGQSLDGEAILTQRRTGQRWAGPTYVASGGLQITATSTRWNLLIVAERGNSRATRWTIIDLASGGLEVLRRYDANPRATSK